jgi:hypothetical protein
MVPENPSLVLNTARSGPSLTSHITIYMVKHFSLKVLAEARRRKTWSILLNRRKVRLPEVKTLLLPPHLLGKVQSNLYNFHTPSVSTVASSFRSDV